MDGTFETNTTPIRQRSRRLIFITSIVVVCLLAVGGFTLFLITRSSQSSKPTVLGVFQKQVDYALYYPTKLPVGYEVDESTISSGDGVVIYQISHTSGDKINVSLQKKPDGFDYEEFYRETLQSPKSELLPIGKITFGKINRGSLASIEAGNTWILINSTSPLEYDQLKPLIQAFENY